MLPKNIQITLIILTGILCLAPVCPMGGNPNPPTVGPDGPNPVDPVDPPDPVDIDDGEDAWHEFAGDLACRPVGMQPRWLRAPLPIPMAGCSRNFQIRVPHAVWNSKAAADPSGFSGAFGKGWNLEFEQTLEVLSDRAIVRGGDLTEMHFSLEQGTLDGKTVRRWVPQPYLSARLLEPGPGQDYWVFVDLDSNSRSYFARTTPSSPYLSLEMLQDRHGHTVVYLRDDSGRLEYISDSVVSHDSARPWWYQITWDGNRISEIRDAADRTWNYTYNSDDNLGLVILPGGPQQQINYQSGSALISEVTLPNLPGHPMRYRFDPQGHLEEIFGLDGSREYRVSWDNLAPDLQEVRVEGPHGALWTATYTLLPRGQYMFLFFAEGKSWVYGRNDEGYLTMLFDDQNRFTQYQPDDAPRPGSVTTILHPANSVASDSYIEEITWGPLGRPIGVKKTPGAGITISYAGLHDCGFEAPDWAFLLPCRAEGAGSTITMRYSTENQGGDDERRVTVVQHSRKALSGRRIVRNRHGQVIEEHRASGSSLFFTRNARGYAVAVEQHIHQGGDSPTTYGTRKTAVYDAMGTIQSDRQEALVAAPGRTPVSWEKEYAYEADGALLRVRSSKNGTLLEENSYQLRNPSGIPQLELSEVVLPDSTRTGMIWRDMDTFGRILATESFVPDQVSGEETSYGLGHVMNSGHKTYQD